MCVFKEAGLENVKNIAKSFLQIIFSHYMRGLTVDSLDYKVKADQF